MTIPLNPGCRGTLNCLGMLTLTTTKPSFGVVRPLSIALPDLIEEKTK